MRLSQVREAEFAASFEELERTIAEACAMEEGWEARVAAGIRGALEFAAADPARARILVVVPRQRQEEVVERLMSLFSEIVPTQQRSQISNDWAILWSIATVAKTHLLGNAAGRLPSLAPDLLYLALMPYAGSAAAERAAKRLELEL
jgi:hypothetical protein